MSDWLFGPGSMSWRINREGVLLLGGRAALLMQLAHPSVAAGVADHSDFQADPVARLRRTLDVMLTIIFSDRATAERAAEGVRHVHASVAGTTPDGHTYSARDPRLLLWVFATLVDSSARLYETAFGPLSADEATAYYDESKVVGHMFGIPERVMPHGLEGLRAWMEGMVTAGEVRVTPQAREVAEPILRPVGLVPRRLARESALVTAALLPEPIRAGYGLRVTRPSALLLTLGGRASRLVLPRIPASLRAFPAARLAARL